MEGHAVGGPARGRGGRLAAEAGEHGRLLGRVATGKAAAGGRGHVTCGGTGGSRPHRGCAPATPADRRGVGRGGAAAGVSRPAPSRPGPSACLRCLAWPGALTGHRSSGGPSHHLGPPPTPRRPCSPPATPASTLAAAVATMHAAPPQPPAADASSGTPAAPHPAPDAAPSAHASGPRLVPAPPLVRRDTLVPPSHPRPWQRPASVVDGLLPFQAESSASAAARCTPSPPPPREWRRVLDNRRLDAAAAAPRARSSSRSPSRSPSPSRSHSTSPPPSASSAFASAHSMSDGDDDSTFGQRKDKPKAASAHTNPGVPARTTFATLPYEILLQILRHVQNGSPEHLNRCLVVNRRWCSAALELIWYKPTFHTPRAFDRMVTVLAQASGARLPSHLESALAALQIEDQSSLESPSSAAATTGGMALEPAPARLDALSDQAAPEEESVLPMVTSGTSNPFPPTHSLDLVSSSSSSSITSASVSTTSLSAHGGEPMRPQVMFPYTEYVRRINCSPIGKDLVGARADVFATLASCTQLERLTLAGAKSLPDTVLRAVLPQCTTLVAIDLTDVAELTDETLAALAQACPRLQGINVTNCTRTSSKGIVPLALSCPLLRRVKLGNCVLVDDHAVVMLARNCRHLLEIDLTGCTEITDAGVAALWRHTHVLRELKLTGCGQLTASGFPAHNAGLIRRTNILSNGIVLDNERGDDGLPASQQLLDDDDVSYEGAVFSDPSALYPPAVPSRPSATMPASSLAQASELALGPLGPLAHAPRPPRIFEQLRILDLGQLLSTD